MMAKASSIRPVLRMTAKIAWSIPGRFTVANLFGGSYVLRSVVFHNIAEHDTPFTRGISVNMSLQQFEAKLRFINKHYCAVGLDDVLEAANGGHLPKRAILVTFDDAYASVAESAAPLCAKYNIPAVFFVNAALVDNQRLAADNLICYVASEFGMEKIVAAVRQISGTEAQVPNAISDIFHTFLPNISPEQRRTFLEALCSITNIDECKLAREAGLYLTSAALRRLSDFRFELGNHTYTHIHCRTLKSTHEMVAEIDQNRNELERLSGRKVRSFSVPYGSASDVPATIATHLQQTGHQVVLLSQSVANHQALGTIDRVSVHAQSDAEFFQEIEVFPRMRTIRNAHFRN